MSLHLRQKKSQDNQLSICSPPPFPYYLCVDSRSLGKLSDFSDVSMLLPESFHTYSTHHYSKSRSKVTSGPTLHGSLRSTPVYSPFALYAHQSRRAFILFLFVSMVLRWGPSTWQVLRCIWYECKEIIGSIKGKKCPACLSMKEAVTLNQTSVFQTHYLAWETTTFVSVFCVSKFV